MPGSRRNPGDRARGRRFSRQGVHTTLLAAITAIAYANAWPDSVTYDDRVFVDAARFADLGLAGFGRFFTEDLWAATGAASGLYRPLLLASIAVQSWLFGDWLPGYHLVNIALHILATVLVCGLARYVLEANGFGSSQSSTAALLAAVIFGVHPIHAEAVNSIFNGSEIYASIGIVGGLLWFLRTCERAPVTAWLGLNLVYFLVLLCRESAAALPALALAMILFTRHDPWLARLRRCIPALSLLAPLLLYLALRGHALEPPREVEQAPVAPPAARAPAPEKPVPEAVTSAPEIVWNDAIRSGLESISPRPERLASAAILWFEGWKIVLWPHPLQVRYDDPETSAWVAIALQSLLLLAVLFAGARNRPALLAGISFYYLAFVPSSQIFGTTISNPGLADRILYLPSAGLTLALAAGFGVLLHRRRLLATALPAAALTMVLVPVTWSRNTEWSSDTRLLESAYRKLEDQTLILNSLLAAYLREDDFRRAAETCDEHAKRLRRAATWGVHCGSAYSRLGRFDEAEQAYLSATHSRESAPYAYANLATMNLHLGNRGEAQAHFESAIAAQRKPFLKEYFRAVMLTQLYPGDRPKLMEARTHLLRALELQPQHSASRAELDALDERLNAAATP